MATLKLTIIKGKPLKDGKIKIKIAVCHKQETAYINTRFSIDNTRQWSDGSVVRREDASILNKKLRSRLAVYENVLDSIPNTDIYNCKQLKNLLVAKCGNDGQRTFSSIVEEYKNGLIAEKRDSYATLISDTAKYFKSSLKGNDILLSDIDQTTIANFKKWVSSNTKAGEATIGKYLSHIKRLINYSIEQQYVKYSVHPFINTKISRSRVREIDISIESMKKIRDSKPISRPQTIARDLFMLSFYTGGMNLVDILTTSFIEDDIEYTRTKTKRRSATVVNVPITPQIKSIVDKYINKRNGRLSFGYKASYNTFRRNVSRDLEKLVESLGIEEPLMFSSARKTFSQFASDLGIPKTVIDYCLGHSTTELGVISYYIKVKKQQAKVAIEKVTDYLEHPEKYKELIEMRQSFIAQTFE